MKKQVSAGGVVFRRDGDDIKVVLVSVKSGSVWTLPKGLIERGEQPDVAAVREVQEETGLRGRIVDSLDTISYWYFLKDENTKYHKTVHYYLMEYAEGSTDDHDREVDEAAWFSLDDALKMVKYRGDKEILERAKKRLSSADGHEEDSEKERVE
ncbi:MAG: NUDIX hydrolase [Nitrospirae bacterium]|nr:NUDIX hydrolase [Nitrospirota bacterium]